MGILDFFGKGQWNANAQGGPIFDALKNNRMEGMQFGAGILANPGNFGQGLQQGLLAAQASHQAKVQKQKREAQLAEFNKAISTVPEPMRQSVMAAGLEEGTKMLADYWKEQNKLRVVGPGGAVVDSKGKVQGERAPFKDNTPATSVREYEYMTKVLGIPAKAAAAMAFGEVTGTPEQLGLGDYLTKGDRSDAAIAASAGYGNLGEIDRTIEALQKPGVGGSVENLIREKGAALTGQIPGEVGKNLSDKFDPDQNVTKALTQARTTLGRSLRAITGEEGGRYTEAEREFAAETMKTLAFASKQQMLAALNQLKEVEMRATKRNELLVQNLPDVTSKGATAQYIREQVAMGRSQEDVVDEVRKLRELYGIPRELVN